MLIFILNDVQYSKKAVFYFEKVRMVKITPPQVPTTSYKNSPVKFLIPTPMGRGDLPQPPFNFIRKTLRTFLIL